MCATTVAYIQSTGIIANLSQGPQHIWINNWQEYTYNNVSIETVFFKY